LAAVFQEGQIEVFGFEPLRRREQPAIDGMADLVQHRAAWD
jgi:hypothetical protein